MAVKWKWKPAAGGSVPADLTQKVNQNTNNITNLQQNTATKQYVNEKIQKRIIDANIGRGTTYTIDPAPGYEIISVMAGRRRTNDNFYFFTSDVNLKFQVFLHSDGTYKIYTADAVSGFGPEYKIIVVEKKL